jgi:hypothetical protein
LVESGLLQISRKLYGDIGPAFYGLRTTLLTFLLMALLRIKRPEHLKEKDPAAFGRLLGLDRAPEVKALRRRLARLAAHHCAEQLSAELARVRVNRRGHLMGFLYVDGHVRAYHGAREILSNAHVARRHLAMPATTDYWVNEPELRDYRAFLRGADFIVATPSDDENEDVCGSGFGFSAFGFLFSRLPLCSRFAMAGLLGSRVSDVYVY